MGVRRAEAWIATKDWNVNLSPEDAANIAASYSARGTHRRERKTNWARVDAMSDREVESAIESDPVAAPILDKEWFRKARLVLPQRKVPISLRMDREVVEWFKARGRRYQSRMNAVLRAYVEAHRKAG